MKTSEIKLLHSNNELKNFAKMMQASKNNNLIKKIRLQSNKQRKIMITNP